MTGVNPGNQAGEPGLTISKESIMRRYNCSYEYSLRHGQPTHRWTLVGAAGAIRLHIKGPDNRFKPEYYGGLETHRKTSPDGRAPDHEDCRLLGGHCWHEGSSLAASEIWIPRWLSDPHNHDSMFAALEVEADRLLLESVE